MKLRADRLTSNSADCLIVCETSLEQIYVHIKNTRPDLVVIDSIQTISTETLESSPGSIAQVINKFMVRHFVKPGITGWAQVTGYRGETKELWQMEGRVSRDIWYIEHWTFMLDLYIIYKTVYNAIHGEKEAY